MDYGKGQGPGKEGGGFNFGGQDPTQMSGSLYRSPAGGEAGGKGAAGKEGGTPGMDAPQTPQTPQTGMATPHAPAPMASLADRRAAAAQRFDDAGGMEGLGFTPSGSGQMLMQNHDAHMQTVLNPEASSVTTDSSQITMDRGPAQQDWRALHVMTGQGNERAIHHFPQHVQDRIRQNIAAGADPMDPRITSAPVDLYLQRRGR